ncbi:MAG: hypothetical protein KDB23_07890, partial [Planctomycetales bacterium]|nr:hypothetical protein [Planctomycetales bacterium]
VTNDGTFNNEDRDFWVTKIKQTYFGDADLDGEFNSADLINVFQAGEYEDHVVGNSTWSTGDWNGDGEFTTSDLVIAFQDGGYDRGPRGVVTAVPEPTGLFPLFMSALGVVARTRRIAI